MLCQFLLSFSGVEVVSLVLTLKLFCASIISMDIQVLTKAGLSESQAKGYFALLHNGGLSAQDLSNTINENRTNCYAIIDKLIALGLAERVEGASSFRATHPSNLRKMMASRQKKIIEIDRQIASFLPSLTSSYNLANNQPGTFILEGVEGVNRLYDDILRTGNNISIISSKYDRLDKEISKTIDLQIKKQKEKGIKVRSIIADDDLPQPEDIPLMNKSGIELRIAKYQAHAQIIIYGDSVAISTFPGTMLTIVISQPLIAATLQSLFEILWSGAETLD
jgi:sugar-specific transcriptional regulator TrmB